MGRLSEALAGGGAPRGRGSSRGGMVDIRAFGDKNLQRRLKQLDVKAQKSLVRKALRVTAKSVRATTSKVTPVDEGDLKWAMLGAKIRAGRGRRGMIRLGVVLPARAELNIPADAKYYYPTVLEYGAKRAKPPRGAQPFLRPGVDNYQDQHRRIFTSHLSKLLRAAWSF